jgi:hypothetical protein
VGLGGGGERARGGREGGVGAGASTAVDVGCGGETQALEVVGYVIEPRLHFARR